MVIGCAALTVATCGGFAAAAGAVCAVASGVAAATTASTVAAAALIGSATVYGTAVIAAAATSNSVEEFNDKGDWSVVISTTIAAVAGGVSGYNMSIASNPKSSQKVDGKSSNNQASCSNFNTCGSKNANYIRKRGWNTSSINAAISNGKMGTSINKANNQPCSVYCYPGTNSYVVIEDSTGSLVQASQFGDSGWVPDSTIKWDP